MFNQKNPKQFIFLCLDKILRSGVEMTSEFPFTIESTMLSDLNVPKGHFLGKEPLEFRAIIKMKKVKKKR